MMTVVGPIDHLLVAARQHVDAWRLAEALAAYRAAIALDPFDPRGHVGHAQCVALMGPVGSAVDELARVGRDFIERGHTTAARVLLVEALRLDPSQLDLHVDIAEIDIATGDRTAGLARLHELAMAYFASGQMDEGRCVLASIEAVREPGAVVAAQTGHTEPMSVILQAPRSAPREETVIARTLLRFPDGTPMLTPRVEPTKTTVAPPTPRARFRVPIAPRLKPPTTVRLRQR